MVNISGMLSTDRVNKISFKNREKRYPKENKKRSKSNNKSKELENESIDENKPEQEHVVDISI
ncbi:MAG: hypothetical protein ACMUJM_10685 [bacterium]